MKTVNNTFIGIDPGFGGAIAIFDHSLNVRNMPEKPEEIYNFLKEYEGARVMIEKVNMRASDNKRIFAISRMMENYHYLISATRILKMNVRFITAQEWQKKFQLPKEYTEKKRELCRLAKERYPRIKPTLQTCDAILILEHLRLTTYEKLEIS